MCYRYLPLVRKAHTGSTGQDLGQHDHNTVVEYVSTMHWLDVCCSSNDVLSPSTEKNNKITISYEPFYAVVDKSAKFVILFVILCQNNFFPKILSETLSECQTVRIQIRTDILSVLIWVQSICKCYQQTTKFIVS